LDKSKIEEKVNEIEQSEYFQNVLSQVKKIRAIKNRDLKKRSEIWRELFAKSEQNKLDYFLDYYQFQIPKEKPDFLNNLMEIKSSELKFIENDKFHSILEEFRTGNHNILKFQFPNCSELEEITNLKGNKKIKNKNK
jgi:hypothetical protein